MQQAQPPRAAAPEPTGSPVSDLLQAFSPAWLVLDYDGTLAEFSPRPTMVEFRPDVASLVHSLADNPLHRVVILSGRSLQIVRQLLPLKQIFLAGVYGMDIQSPDGALIHRADLATLRPFLEEIKPAWENLISGHAGFFLEDKEWSLALHAQSADRHLAMGILDLAMQMAEPIMPAKYFRWFADECYIEIAPVQAHKGQALRYILSHYPFPARQVIYVGDDDKDAEAFETVHAFGGVNVLVFNPMHPDPPAATDRRLASPAEVRKWLESAIQG